MNQKFKKSLNNKVNNKYKDIKSKIKPYIDMPLSR